MAALHDAQRSQQPNKAWAFAFVSDTLIDEEWSDALTLIDPFTQECLAIHVGTSIKGSVWAVWCLGASRWRRAVHSSARLSICEPISRG
ncbi:hypothetical protein GCM10008949_39580 [Deinococcus humi]|nr:hypothetical protein GCM10008949_39580 [Deinococcus humi]